MPQSTQDMHCRCGVKQVFRRHSIRADDPDDPLLSITINKNEGIKVAARIKVKKAKAWLVSCRRWNPAGFFPDRLKSLIMAN